MTKRGRPKGSASRGKVYSSTQKALLKRALKNVKKLEREIRSAFKKAGKYR